MASSNDTPDAASSGDTPDATCAAYDLQKLKWDFCHDVRRGTPAFRGSVAMMPDATYSQNQSAQYLPKFLSEDTLDYQARLAITWAFDAYEQTAQGLMGIVFARGIKRGDDIDKKIVELLENIDGEGQNLDVFARQAFDEGLDGHVAILTEYPNVPVGSNLTLDDLNTRGIRPYMRVVRADQIISWVPVVIGGIERLAQVVIKECIEEKKGRFGTKEVEQYRVFTQEVIYDQATTTGMNDDGDPVGDPQPIGLGEITWEVWKEQDVMASNGRRTGRTAIQIDTSGTVRGPKTIPLRVAYLGRRLGMLKSEPYLWGLAQTNVEHTQVTSDYAIKMHKMCNPTPVFIGRDARAKGEGTVKMGGYGIDVPMGGDAKMLETSGVDIGAVRTRLVDLERRMELQGGIMLEGKTDASPMTATEVAIMVRSRNGRLKAAVESLKDALEGAQGDMAAYMGLDPVAGGSLEFDTSFFEEFNLPFVQLCWEIYLKDGIDLAAMQHVLRTGKLPDDMGLDDALLTQLAALTKDRMLAEAKSGVKIAEAEGVHVTATTPDGTNIEATGSAAGPGGGGGAPPPPGKGQQAA
jgi:hypothetical protein